MIVMRDILPKPAVCAILRRSSVEAHSRPRDGRKWTQDSAGVLADGSKVDGPVALRNVLLSRPDAFVTTLTERIMTYGLGRGVEPSDMPVIRGIVKRAAADNYRFSSIIMGIVESAPFRLRTVPAGAPPGP